MNQVRYIFILNSLKFDQFSIEHSLFSNLTSLSLDSAFRLLQPDADQTVAPDYVVHKMRRIGVDVDINEYKVGLLVTPTLKMK
jgi:hypothetical protein